MLVAVNLRSPRIAACMIVSLVAYSAYGHEQVDSEFDESKALQISQASVGATVGDYQFASADGQNVRLADLDGRPIVINLIYTSCYHTCPMLTSHLSSVAEIAIEALGADGFLVLTIGFDSAMDTPQRMRQYATDRDLDLPNWRFLSADTDTVKSLTRDLGFTYFASPNGFDHTIQTTVLDADRRVYRQIYGSSFDSPQLVEPLKDLIFGTRVNASSVSGWINGVRLICTVYDPTSGRYRFDYSLFVAIGVGLACLGGVAAFIVREWRQNKPFRSAT
ncbi:MAG: SCO family protein [Gammaproteobacteria bacterium]|nr:SCO family protein [Gammaproteobacteria bacterium]